MTGAVVIAALLAVAATSTTAAPFLREPEAADDALEHRGPLGERRLELSEERDRALLALRELEFDHRTGKITDEDYRGLVISLRQAAAAALQALDQGRDDRATAETD